jgi:CheY-like chemotaxis protein
VFDLAFVDLRLGTNNGLDLIPPLLGECPWMKIVVITAYASIDTAVEAMRRGASSLFRSGGLASWSQRHRKKFRYNEGVGSSGEKLCWFGSQGYLGTSFCNIMSLPVDVLSTFRTSHSASRTTTLAPGAMVLVPSFMVCLSILIK